MKKGLKYLGVIFTFILVLTGCSKKDPNEMLENALEKTSKLESIHEKVGVEGSVKIEGAETKFSFSVDGDTIQKDDTFKSHMIYNIGLYGFNFQGEAYADLNKTNVELYGQFMGNWYKVASNVDSKLYDEYKKELEEEMKDYSSKDILKYAKSVTEVKTDKDGYTKLEVVVDKEKINNEFKEELKKTIEESKKQLEDAETEVQEELKEIEEDETFKSLEDGILSEDITLVVYLKDGYIAYFEYDLQSIINNIINKVNLPEDVLAEYKKYDLNLKYTVEYSDFNKVKDIVVPDDVKSNAEDMTEKLNELSEEALEDFSSTTPIDIIDDNVNVVE